LLKKNQTKNRC